MEAGHDRTAPEAGQDGALHRGILCLPACLPACLPGWLALAAYLSQARPATPLRQVFLAAKAPTRAIPPGPGQRCHPPGL
jgi:hypothetical protein